MKKEELVIQITRAMHNKCGKFESFNSYQFINSYFLDLEFEGLLGIATQNGIKFSNAYSSAPVCAPSRYSIQFGKSPARELISIILESTF